MVAASPLPSHASSPATGWSLAHRVAFRFVFLYAILYVLPFPAGYVPWTEWLSRPYGEGALGLVRRVGEDLLGLGPVAIQPNGSGDTTADYLLLLCIATLAGIGTIVWSALDRRRVDYVALDRWLRVGIRYVLAITMMSYGLAKVLKSQFPAPSAARLTEEVGDMSPMGLVWTFMGYSTPYTVFAGAMEVLGGVLLFWRRTTLLGALLLVPVMGNVVLLNFCYDVPVKLYSSHLLAMAVFLILPDARRLASVLFGRAVEARPLRPHFSSRRAARVALVAKVLLIAGATYQQVTEAWESYTTWGDGAPRPALDGNWEIEAMTRDGVDVPPLLTDATAWRRMTVTARGVRIETMDGEATPLRDGHLPLARLLLLREFDDGAAPFAFFVRRPDADTLEVRGIWDGHAITARMRRDDDFRLMTRGFRWINEAPYNR